MDTKTVTLVRHLRLPTVLLLTQVVVDCFALFFHFFDLLEYGGTTATHAITTDTTTTIPTATSMTDTRTFLLILFSTTTDFSNPITTPRLPFTNPCGRSHQPSSDIVPSCTQWQPLTTCHPSHTHRPCCDRDSSTASLVLTASPPKSEHKIDLNDVRIFLNAKEKDQLAP